MLTIELVRPGVLNRYYLRNLFTRVSVIGRELRARDTKNSISIRPMVFVQEPKKYYTERKHRVIDYLKESNGF